MVLPEFRSSKKFFSSKCSSLEFSALTLPSEVFKKTLVLVVPGRGAACGWSHTAPQRPEREAYSARSPASCASTSTSRTCSLPPGAHWEPVLFTEQPGGSRKWPCPEAHTPFPVALERHQFSSPLAAAASHGARVKGGVQEA